MKMSRPILILAVLTVLAVLYLFWRDHNAEEPARVSARRQAATSIVPVMGPAIAEAVEGAAQAPSATNLFGAQTWAPPPPPPPTPEQLAEEARKNPPRAPPLPFAIVSTWRESGTTYIGMSANGQDVIVCRSCSLPGSIRQGQTLLGIYRLDSVTDRTLVFTFLPLKQKQELPLGEIP